ncbi:MAG: four helix bundle protein [Prevotella sp.]|nr:four helix bundle protein [Prevotella sp.]
MESITERKSFEFSIRIVNLYKYLTTEKKEYVMSKQLIRSGTSVGANISEAQFGQSKADFGTKMQIALKEAYETRYWIRLLKETEYLTEQETQSILLDCEELINMLASTCKTVFPRNFN